MVCHSEANLKCKCFSCNPNYWPEDLQAFWPITIPNVVMPPTKLRCEMPGWYNTCNSPGVCRPGRSREGAAKCTARQVPRSVAPIC